MRLTASMGEHEKLSRSEDKANIQAGGDKLGLK
jgi:hypothetical protein